MSSWSAPSFHALLRNLRVLAPSLDMTRKKPKKKAVEKTRANSRQAYDGPPGCTHTAFRQRVESHLNRADLLELNVLLVSHLE